jgi:ribosomal protein L24
MRNDFVEGDRVEVTKPKLQKGARGRVMSVDGTSCKVRITSAGENFNMVSKIGSEITYPKSSLKGI